MSFGVTSSGFVLKTFPDIISDMELEAKIQFGNDIDLSSVSPLKKFIDSIAAEEAILWQQLEAVYYSAYLDTASGTNLDSLIALIGYTRKAAIKATGSVTFTGVEGTVVPVNISVQTLGINPIIFKTVTSATITSGTATVNVTAVIGGITGNVAGGTITVLTNPILGISTVNNSAATSGGEDTESDEALRIRVKTTLSGGGAATLDAIRVGILLVTGVTSVSIEENDTVTDNTGNGGLPPKSFRVMVLGGSNNAIAQAIFDNKPAGIQAYGDVSGVALADDGSSYNIYFRRPTEVLIYVDVVLTKGSMFPIDGNIQVETAIISYIGGTDANALLHIGLNVGDDVIFNQVVSAVVGIQGVLDAVVKISRTNPPIETSNIVIGSTEKAVTTITAMTIT